MIFTEIDKKTMQTLTTLVKFSSPVTNSRKDSLIRNGQHLGVPKDDILELLEEWEEYDVIRLKSKDEKRRFLNRCFAFMHERSLPTESDKDHYSFVEKNLGLN